MTGLHLTDRALSDLDQIERYSVEQWGQKVANEYIDDLGVALGRLAANLSLFAERQDYSGRLRFYRTREHVLIGDVLNGAGYVMAIWHGSMDFIDRLADLEPLLVREAEFLAAQIQQKEG